MLVEPVENHPDPKTIEALLQIGLLEMERKERVETPKRKIAEAEEEEESMLNKDIKKTKAKDKTNDRNGETLQGKGNCNYRGSTLTPWGNKQKSQRR